MPGLFDAYDLNSKLRLKNRITMAPMTRSRTSQGDSPNALMAKYYSQRASAGLIITEATDVSPTSKGYAWTPGIYTDEQIKGWQLVTDAVHRERGVIFLQIWHVGRMAHTSMMPGGQAPWGATDEPAGQSDVFVHGVDGKIGFIRASTPRQMTAEDISDLVREFRTSFRNAESAGFDGVEIHGANGYLFDQFMNSVLNKRSDAYGGQTPQTRARLLLDVVDAAIEELGVEKIGVRISPFGKFNSMPSDPNTEETLLYLCTELNRRKAAYLHIVYQLMPSGNVEGSVFDDSNLSADLVRKIREAFLGTLMWCGGFGGDTAQSALDDGWADMIAFGRPFIANPDLVERLKNDWPLAEADQAVFYTRNGEQGYTDFPRFEARGGTSTLPDRRK